MKKGAGTLVAPLSSHEHQHEQTPKKRPPARPPTFLLELPFRLDAGQAARVRGHLEAGRQLSNSILSEGQHRLQRMRADLARQAAWSLARTQPRERAADFAALRQAHRFSQARLHEAVKGLCVAWIAEHIDGVLAQTLAIRAYHARSYVCLAKPKGSGSRVEDGASAAAGVLRVQFTLS